MPIGIGTRRVVGYSIEKNPRIVSRKLSYPSDITGADIEVNLYPPTRKSYKNSWTPHVILTPSPNLLPTHAAHTENTTPPTRPRTHHGPQATTPHTPQVYITHHALCSAPSHLGAI